MAFTSGRFNVGMMAFRRDVNGLEGLDWYRQRCLEWCFDRYEDGKYGDQMYLDQFPSLFEGVHVLKHPGANVAPWNWMNGRLTCDSGGLRINGERVIFYHFHGFKLFSPRLYDPCRAARLYDEMPRALTRCIYRPYARGMAETLVWARERGVPFEAHYDRIKTYGPRIFVSKVRREKLFLCPPIR